MTRKTLKTELSNLRKRAERNVQKIEQISYKLYSKITDINKIIDEYNAKRSDFFMEEFRVRGMTWCTQCFKVFPAGEAELLLFEGEEKYSHGYGNSCYGFHNFSILHRVCPMCRERAHDHHGMQGERDGQTNEREIFYAFHVEEREDGYYGRKFGNWVKLEGENYRYKLPEPPNRVIEQISKEWSLPPRIEFDRNGLFKIIIHE
jgi:hypothetical protein